MDFKTIKFSQNWNNKLDCKFFTTIRKANYHVNLGDLCIISLRDKLYKWAICRHAQQVLCSDMATGLIILDTGLELDPSLSLFKSVGINWQQPGECITFLMLEVIEKPGGSSLALPEALRGCQQSVVFPD